MATNDGSITQFTSWFHLIDFLISYILTSKPTIKANVVGKTFQNKWKISIYYSIVYLVFIFYGTKWMKNRQPYNLRIPLAIWSGFLSIFSIMGSLTAVPEFAHILITKGFLASYCDNCFINDSNIIFWYTLFSLSKVIELFDTAFIVLRKQKLILLHWVHHVLTLIYTFYIFGFLASTARWMVTMNLVVHSVMYGYYCLRALQIRISRYIAMAITISQIVQMIFGLIIHVHIVIRLISGLHCDCPLQGAVFAVLIKSVPIKQPYPLLDKNKNPTINAKQYQQIKKDDCNNENIHVKKR